MYTRITCGVCPTNRILDIISYFWLADNCWGVCLSQESSDDVQADLLGSHLRSALVLWWKMWKKSSNLLITQNENKSYLFCHLGYNNKSFSSSSSSFSSFSSFSFIPLKSEFKVATVVYSEGEVSAQALARLSALQHQVIGHGSSLSECIVIPQRGTGQASSPLASLLLLLFHKHMPVA